MSPRRKKTLVIVGAVGLLVVAVAWRMLRTGAPRVREIAGATITTLDAANQSAEVEFIHPKTGRTTKIGGTLAPGCQIFIDDRPAQFSDLHVGDSGSVKGLIRATFSGYTVEAQLVRISRSGQATQPASTTQPAAKP